MDELTIKYIPKHSPAVEFVASETYTVKDLEDGRKRVAELREKHKNDKLFHIYKNGVIIFNSALIRR